MLVSSFGSLLARFDGYLFYWGTRLTVCFLICIAPTPAPSTSIFGAPAPATGGLFGAPGASCCSGSCVVILIHDMCLHLLFRISVLLQHLPLLGQYSEHLLQLPRLDHLHQRLVVSVS